jgi:hypothetical protein
MHPSFHFSNSRVSKPHISPENDLSSGSPANLLQEKKFLVDDGYNPFARVLEDLADLDSEPEGE